LLAELVGRVVVAEAVTLQHRAQAASHLLEQRGHLVLARRRQRPDNDNAGQGRVVRRLRLGGLLSHYYREAA
jgi:hypothetical protein